MTCGYGFTSGVAAAAPAGPGATFPAQGASDVMLASLTLNSLDSQTDRGA